MDKKLCHVDKENFVILQCPHCQQSNRVSAAKFQNKKHSITVRCKCKNTFQVQLNFRRYYRKIVNISGEIVLPTDDNERQAITICDLSMTGLRFKMIQSVGLNVGDSVRVKFDLATRNPTTIEKDVVVRYVGDGYYGCEFKELGLEEKALGFFLLS